MKTPASEIWMQHPAHLIALGFGSGLFPVAPGTIATLWAWVVFIMIDPFLSDLSWAALLCAGLFIGVWACSITGRAMGEPDSSAMVWDEIIAFWFVLWVLPKATDPAGFVAMGGVPEWLIQLVGFALFRFFDIVKPPPIRTIDRLSHDGWGVMLDDLFAAGYTLIACALLLRLAHLIGF
ncbi:MAG: phosphatidylglycerophosphatase A [Betaproteobacteria bacterium]|nr:phosphatidylglycerophosphatase A [Betaproteobacteria bacterium]